MSKFQFDDGIELMEFGSGAFIQKNEEECISLPVGCQFVHPSQPHYYYEVVGNEDGGCEWVQHDADELY